MILKELNYDYLGIARAIIVGDSGFEYTTQIDGELKRSWCSCPINVFNKEEPCKHILFLLGIIEREKMVNKREDLNHLATGSMIVDNLLGGGVPYGIVTGVFGPPMAGKSMFNYQAGLANIKYTKDKTLLIDTEGLRPQDFKTILTKFKDRWNLSDEDVSKRFEMITTLGDTKLKSIQKLFMMMGVLFTWEQSEGGRYTPYFNECKATMPDEKWAEYSLIIIDSMTKPLKDCFGSNTPNLPARAQIIDRLFGKLFDIARRHNTAILISHHASCDPMVWGKDPGSMWGGDPVLYNTKYAIEFFEATKKVKEETGWGIETRRVKLVRRPDEQTTNEWIPIRLQKDFGYTDT